MKMIMNLILFVISISILAFVIIFYLGSKKPQKEEVNTVVNNTINPKQFADSLKIEIKEKIIFLESKGYEVKITEAKVQEYIYYWGGGIMTQMSNTERYTKSKNNLKNIEIPINTSIENFLYFLDSYISDVEIVEQYEIGLKPNPIIEELINEIY